MKAKLITQFRSDTDDGIIQISIWQVLEPVPPSGHCYKYSLVYVKSGKRVVGFDNERGKGDHCHLDGKEFPYTFVSLEQLGEDFAAEVAKRKE
ncbi:MAG: DUF6516 family protein [Betaproteobacteria bacterium]|nr:DUF6516 family protein [Betaproteobacteria bacterium]